MNKSKEFSLPTSEQLENELKHERNKRGYSRRVRRVVYLLIIVAALAVLLSTFVVPVLKIYGTSMSPALEENEIVVALKNIHINRGDMVAFYFNNKILVKRVIAGPGSQVNIGEDGQVFVDGVRLSEPYVKDFARGECDIDMPYTVPEGRYFVMGDNRAISVDSRISTVGCISEEQIIGKVVLIVWPLSRLGIAN